MCDFVYGKFEYSNKKFIVLGVRLVVIFEGREGSDGSS